MPTPTAPPTPGPLPGTEPPRRFRPRLRYELIGCALHGHELVGLDAAAVRPQDALFARDADGVRWYRCLRCDSWLPLPPPTAPSREHPPDRPEIEVPLRGRPLRDRFVLRLIAVDRVLHFLVLGALAGVLVVFAAHRKDLRGDYTRVLNALQGGFGGPSSTSRGILKDVNELFRLSPAKLHVIAAVVAGYAALNAVEAVGLWRGKRWAAYLTLLEVALLLPLEIYELTITVSWLKLLTMVLNVAVLVYLLFVHRLFGFRGGAAAEEVMRVRDSGWPPLERATPWLLPEAEPAGAA